MRHLLVSIVLISLASTSFAQTIINQNNYDSKSLVDTNSTNNTVSIINSTSNTTTNNNTTSISTVNSNNVNSGTMNYNNNNISSNINTNINTGDVTNRNINSSNSTNVNIQQGDMTNRNINETVIRQRLEQPPPTAIAPSMMSGGNSDLCTTGISGGAQTQILGMSFGGTQRDENCERLKLSKTLFDMGMKVAAVATMCQDRRVFDAMMTAGTPCPYEGLIGEQAKEAWQKNPEKLPKAIK